MMKHLIRNNLCLLIILVFLVPGYNAWAADLTSYIAVNKTRPVYDYTNLQTYTSVNIENISTETLTTPLQLVIDSISVAGVSVANADGVLPDGRPWYDYSGQSGDGTLSPGEVSLEREMRFDNPDILRFAFTVVVLGEIQSIPNIPPEANAGPDQTVLFGNTVTLDGSGSSDANGDPLTFSWSFLERPADSNAMLSDSFVVNPAFSIDVSGNYIVQLIVNDGTANSAADTVVITTDNSPPKADAGADQTVYFGDIVTLDGSGSSDVDGDSLAYLWVLTTVPVGSGAILSDPAAVYPTFSIDLPGTYVATLVVNDGALNSVEDSVIITTGINIPVADAGPDQGALVNDTITLDGSASYDVDGDMLTFAWSFTTKPAGSSADLSDPVVVNPFFTIDLSGTYVIQLIVNDGTQDSPADTVVITTVNTPPNANAGPDQTAYVDDTILLDGSGSSDVDGDALTFSWSFASKPAGSEAVLSDASAVMPTFVVDVFGTYVLQLIVNDGTVNSTPDMMTINILNSIPVADAGIDQFVFINDVVTLDGSGSYDDDQDPLLYEWSFLTRPTGSTAELSSASVLHPVFTVDIKGEYTVQLIVNDSIVNSVPDNVTITTGNTRPVANAGENQSIYLGEVASLDGSSSFDADGDPVTFIWSIVSAPVTSTATLSDTSEVAPTLTPDVAGLYVIQLIVNDGFLNSEPNSTTITVLALPELVINNPTVSEGDEGVVDMTFTVTLSPVTSRVVTLDYATSDSTADAGVDYTATSGSLTFSPGVNTQPVTVSVNGDTDQEPNEFLFLNLANPVNALIAGSQGVGTILNDDVAATITLSPDPLNLLTGETGELVITINTSAGTGGVVVDLASDNIDAATVPATAIIPEGLSSVTVDITAGSVAGVAIISAVASGLTGDTSTVNVGNRVMSLVLEGPLVGVGRSLSGIITLAQAAPTEGVTVSLLSGNTGLVTVAPASVFIAAGENSASLAVSGVAEGATTITATALGYEPATADIAATSNLISIDVLPPIAPEQIIGLPVSLSTPAPTTGVTVNFTMGNPAIASITPSVFVPEGLRIATANPQVTGILIGTTTVTATAIGYAPHTRDVTVTLALDFTPDPLQIVNGSNANITLNLSAPAPVSGLAINLTMDNAEIATVPATINIIAGQTSATIAVSGVTAGSTVLRASAPGITEATATINVVSPPIFIYADQIGRDLQRPVGGYIGAPAPAGNLSVTMTSSDPSRLILSNSDNETGSASITVIVPAGTTGIPNFYAQALADNGNVDIVATAPLYATDTETVQLLESTFIFPFTSVVYATTFSQNISLPILPARIQPVSGQSVNDHTYRPDTLRGGLSLTVAINSSDTSVGITTGPVIINGGDRSINYYFDSLTAGETELVIAQPANFLVAGDARDRVSAIVTTPNIMLGDRDVGINLQRPIPVILESAPFVPTDITISVVDESVAILSSDASSAGSKTVTFTGVTTRTIGTLYVQGLSLGATSITAQGEGYVTATSSIKVEPAGLYFVFGDITTNTFAIDTPTRIKVTRLDPITGERSYDPVYWPSTLRGGISISVDITNNDETVGVFTTPVLLNGGDEYYQTYFDPLAAGVTSIVIAQPGNFTSPADSSDRITATVTAPDIYMEDRTIGINLQRRIPVNLYSAPPVPTDFTISSADPGVVLISTDSTTAGSNSVTFSGATGTTVGQIYVQGMSLGNTTITASATGYNNTTKQVTVDNAAIYFRYGDVETDTFAANSAIAIRGDRLYPGTENVIYDSYYPSSIRGGLNLNLVVTNSNNTAGEIVNSPVPFNGGDGGVTVEFDPLTAGVTSLEIVQPAGFTIPSDGKSAINVIVSAPKVFLGDRIIGKNLQRYIPVRLESAPPSPVDVTISMSSNDIAWISNDATTAGGQTLVFSGVTSTLVGTIYVQGINLGSAVITGKASGYTDAVNDITVTPAGFYIVNYDFNVEENAANRIIGLQADRLDQVTYNPVHDIYYPATIRGGLSVTVPVSSSNTAVGVVATSPVIFNGGEYYKQTEFDPLAAGSTMLTAVTPAGFSTPSNRATINVTVTASVSVLSSTASVESADVDINQVSNTPSSSGSGALGWITLILLLARYYLREIEIKNLR